MKGNKVCIIGAGVAGLATALALAKKGFQVVIVEKNSHPGGRCGQLIHEGHRFDLGASIFLMPSIYKDVFEYLELDLEKDLPSTPLTNLYKMFFADGIQLDFTTDVAAMKSQLESIEPGSYEKADIYIKKGYTLFKKAYARLLGRNFTNWAQFINFSNMALLFKLKTHVPHQRYIKRFFKDKHLQTAFTFQNIYVGQNPLTAPALFSMLPAAELSEGSLVPKGGMFAIVSLLEKKAIEHGVEIQYNKPVSSIIRKNYHVKGIAFEDGSQLDCDLLVANADLPYVYESLLQDSFVTQKLQHKEYACSAIVFHWGLNQKYAGFGHHNVFFSSKYEKNLHSIFQENAMGKEPSFYVYAPTALDPETAPAGQDTISVVVPTGHLSPKNREEWNMYKQLARTSILKRLKAEGFEHIDEHIKFELNSTPRTWEKAFNVSKGAIFGSINHSILQMGYFRPHNKHQLIDNMYFTGGSTHPGCGVPLVLLSAKITSERILRDHCPPCNS